MNYAVFRDGDRISRPFQTEGDAWDCANDAGLVENVPSSGGSVQVLDGHCLIKPCDDEFVMPANLADVVRPHPRCGLAGTNNRNGRPRLQMPEAGSRSKQ